MHITRKWAAAGRCFDTREAAEHYLKTKSIRDSLIDFFSDRTLSPDYALADQLLAVYDIKRKAFPVSSDLSGD